MLLRIGVDFDFTLFVGDWPEVGPLVPGARKYMRLLDEAGHYLIIWSSRASTLTDNDPVQRAYALQRMQDALVRNEIPFDSIDWGQHGKIPADLYLDDRGLGVPLRDFRGSRVVDWPKVYNLVRLEVISRRLR